MPLVLKLIADKLLLQTPKLSLEDYWVNNNNIYLSTHLSIYLSIYLSIDLSLNLSIYCLSIYLSIYQSICRNMSEFFIYAMANFSWYGNPTPKNILGVHWDMVTPGSNSLMKFNKNTGSHLSTFRVAVFGRSLRKTNQVDANLDEVCM